MGIDLPRLTCKRLESAKIVPVSAFLPSPFTFFYQLFFLLSSLLFIIRFDASVVCCDTFAFARILMRPDCVQIVKCFFYYAEDLSHLTYFKRSL